MTAVTDATTVIETLLGRTLTAEQLIRIGDAFAVVDIYGLATFADPENPTNEEKAQLFLDTNLKWGQQVVEQANRIIETDAVQSTIDTNVATAVADFEP